LEVSPLVRRDAVPLPSLRFFFFSQRQLARMHPHHPVFFGRLAILMIEGGHLIVLLLDKVSGLADPPPILCLNVPPDRQRQPAHSFALLVSFSLRMPGLVSAYRGIIRPSIRTFFLKLFCRLSVVLYSGRGFFIDTFPLPGFAGGGAILGAF